MSFLKRGAAAAEEAAAESVRKSQNNFLRFFIKDDGDKRLVRFADGDNPATDPAAFLEHDVPVMKKVKGRMKKVFMPFTCLAPDEECPFCSPENIAKTRYAYTIFDREGYKTKDGNAVKDVRKLYVIGVKQYKQLETFRREALDGGKLTDRDIKIVRNGTGTSTTYSYFAGKEGKFKPDADALEREDFSVEPLNYEEVLKPLSRAEALAVVRGQSKVLDQEEPEIEDDDDDDDEVQIKF